MTKIHIVREGKSLVEISFRRTPVDGRAPDNQVSVIAMLKDHEALVDALTTALVRIVDRSRYRASELVIELADDPLDN